MFRKVVERGMLVLDNLSMTLKDISFSSEMGKSEAQQFRGGYTRIVDCKWSISLYTSLFTSTEEPYREFREQKDEILLLVI